MKTKFHGASCLLEDVGYGYVVLIRLIIRTVGGCVL